MAGRNRREEAIFTRLSVGHSQLNKTLHVIGKHPTGKCEYCQETETVEHVLIQYGHYWRERERMRSSMREKGIQEISLKSILSRTSLYIVSNMIYFLRAKGLAGSILFYPRLAHTPVQ